MLIIMNHIYIYIYTILRIINTLVISLTNINTDINTYPPVSTHASVGFLHLHMFHLGWVQLLRWLVGIWLGANMRPWQRRLAPGDFAEVKDFSAMDNSKQWYNNGLSQIEDNSSYVFSYFLLWGDSSLWKSRSYRLGIVFDKMLAAPHQGCWLPYHHQDDVVMFRWPAIPITLAAGRGVFRKGIPKPWRILWTIAYLPTWTDDSYGKGTCSIDGSYGKRG